MRFLLSPAPRFVEGMLLFIALLLPLAFWPWSLDALELPKQTLLVIGTALALLAWVGHALSERRLTLVKHWILIVPALWALAVLIASAFSSAGYVSVFGPSMQEYQSLLTVVALAAFFFLVVQTFRSEASERRLFFFFLLGAALVSIIAFLVLLRPAWMPSSLPSSFNTIGTANAFGLFGIVVSIMGSGLWLVSGGGEREVFYAGWLGRGEKMAVVVTVLLTLVNLLALDFWALWVVALVGLSTLFLFGILRAPEFPHHHRFLLPMAMAVLSIFFLFLPRPFSLGLPVEVVPSFSRSVEVARQTLAEHTWVLGSGPGTYASDFARFKAPELNQTSFWDTRFDRGQSFILTILTTSGPLVALMFLLFLVVVLCRSLSLLVRERQHGQWKVHFALFGGWAALAASAWLYNWNMGLLFLFVLLSAVLSSQGMREEEIILRRSPRAGLLCSFLFVLVAIGILTLCFVTVQRHMAEATFAEAIRMDRTRSSAKDVAAKIERATRLNRYDDTLWRNLAQSILFVIREDLAAVNGVALSSEQTASISRLTSASIGAAKRATDLNPLQGANWMMRGAIYRELMPMLAGTDAYAVLSFERAMVLEPTNTTPLVGLARTHLSRAVLLNKAVASSDADVSKSAVQKRNAALATAEEKLGEAIRLKSDYAPAHYYLALVYQEEGRLADAYAKLASVAQANALDVGVAFQLGMLSMRMEKFAEAQKAFERAVTLAPDYANARWFLASVYEKQNATNKAIEQLEAMLKTNPDQPMVTARLERIRTNQKEVTIPEPLDASSTAVSP